MGVLASGKWENRSKSNLVLNTYKGYDRKFIDIECPKTSQLTITNPILLT